MHEPYKAAAELRAGDHIPAGFLPGVTGTAEVVYMRRYSRGGQDWVYTVYVDSDGLPDAYPFFAEARVPVEPPAPPPDSVFGVSEGAGPGRHTGEA